MFLSRCDRDLGFPLELQQVSPVSSLIELGTQVSSQSCHRAGKPPLELMWGTRVSSVLSQGSQASPQLAGGTCLPLELQQGSLGLPQVAAGTRGSLELWWEISLPLMLRWGSRLSHAVTTMEKGLPLKLRD